LKRCTSTEHLWKRKLVSLTSPEHWEIFLPRSERSWRADVLIIIIIIINNVLIYVTLSRERCRGTLQSYNNSEEGSKKLAKTEPKQMCLQLLPKGGEG